MTTIPSNSVDRSHLNAMAAEAAQAKADQLQGTKELNDAKRDSYKKQAIQARQ